MAIKLALEQWIKDNPTSSRLQSGDREYSKRGRAKTIGVRKQRAKELEDKIVHVLETTALNQKQIAERLGCSATTVKRAARKHGYSMSC